MKIDKKILEMFPKYLEIVKESGKRIKKKIKEEITPKKGIIVLVDALGTKGMWKQDSGNTTQSQENNNTRKLRQWSHFIDAFKIYIEEQLGTNHPKITFHTFSDTIRIVVETDQIESALIELASCLRAPLITSIVIGRPLRGCITAGDFYKEDEDKNHQLIVGHPIDEAANYFEQPQWIGISASPLAHMIIDKIYDEDKKKIEEIFLECNIPLRQSIEQNAWALRWPDVFADIVSDDPLDLLTDKDKNTNIYEIVNAQLNAILDISAALKWRNTLTFYEQCSDGQTFPQTK